MMVNKRSDRGKITVMMIQLMNVHADDDVDTIVGRMVREIVPMNRH